MICNQLSDSLWAFISMYNKKVAGLQLDHEGQNGNDHLNTCNPSPFPPFIIFFFFPYLTFISSCPPFDSLTFHRIQLGQLLFSWPFPRNLSFLPSMFPSSTLACSVLCQGLIATSCHTSTECRLEVILIIHVYRRYHLLHN